MFREKQQTLLLVYDFTAPPDWLAVYTIPGTAVDSPYLRRLATPRRAPRSRRRLPCETEEPRRIEQRTARVIYRRIASGMLKTYRDPLRAQKKDGLRGS